jgi:LmbE family N-acetylglucosaminyl deacetylase
MSKEIRLIIAPHADDEVLGCASVLRNSYVLYCGINELKLPEHIRATRPSREERYVEIEECAHYMGFKMELLEGRCVNHYQAIDFISSIEEEIEWLKPDKVFIPRPCYNQDHQEIYKACQVALRPHDRNFFVKKVLVYEQPQDMTWDQNDFKVNYFMPLNIEEKINAYKCHKSQVRGMRSPQILQAMAELRGASVNMPYAEAFKIERWVE